MKLKTVILLYVLIAFACNKKLDIQPQNTVPAEELKTADDVKAVLFGAYSTWQNANAFGEKYNTFTELMVNDNDIDWAGTFAEYRDINNKEEDKNAPGVYQVWANSYHTINIANIVLSKLDLLSTDDRTVAEGEAKFFRGVTYYYLVNLFAKPWSAGNVSSNPGVPVLLLPLTAFDPAKDKLPRASVEAVYKQVLADLTDAVSKLPETLESFRATKYSAEAMISRVYLSQAKYAEAAAAANDVIESNAFSLTQLFANAFNNVANSTEDVFAIQQTAQSNTGTADFGITTFYSSYPVGRGELQITDAHLAKYEPGDARGTFFYEGVSISGSPGNMTTKWKNLYKAIPVVRLAEMYLTRAEANFRKGGTPAGPNTPIQDVNVIRNRAGLPSINTLTSADSIVAERFRELAFEGERFFTVKRLKIPVSGHPYDDPRLVFPIPQREIDLGNSLPQNEGY